MPLTQDQFLRVLTRDAAEAAVLAAPRLAPLGAEDVPLPARPGRVLAADIAAPVDAPPFDRATVDGFAVRAADLSVAPGARLVLLQMIPETIPCGSAPQVSLTPGTAPPIATIATGGPIPRGADAVVMIEQTGSGGDGIEGARAAVPGRMCPSPGPTSGVAGPCCARARPSARARWRCRPPCARPLRRMTR